jgi:hypothetical protein
MMFPLLRFSDLSVLFVVALIVIVLVAFMVCSPKVVDGLNNRQLITSLTGLTIPYNLKTHENSTMKSLSSCC